MGKTRVMYAVYVYTHIKVTHHPSRSHPLDLTKKAPNLSRAIYEDAYVYTRQRTRKKLRPLERFTPRPIKESLFFLGRVDRLQHCGSSLYVAYLDQPKFISTKLHLCPSSLSLSLSHLFEESSFFFSCYYQYLFFFSSIKDYKQQPISYEPLPRH